MRFVVVLARMALMLSIAHPPAGDSLADPMASATFSELRSYTSIYAIGLEWDLTGDENHDAQGAVSYRIAGEAEWRPVTFRNDRSEAGRFTSCRARKAETDRRRPLSRG